MTVCKAGISLVNEFFQVKPVHLLFWMRTVALIILLPFFFYFPPPDDPIFYLYLFIASLMVPYADILFVRMTANIGAGVVTRILPLIVALIFMLWLPFAPDLIADYLADPLRLAGILIAVFGSVFFAMRMRKCEISYEALRALMPALILWSISTIIGKLALGRVGGDVGVYYYLLMQCIVVWFCYIVMMRLPLFKPLIEDMDLKSELVHKSAILAGLVFGGLWVLATGSRWLAIDQVENPAYISVIGLLSPFLVMFVYRILGRKEDAHILPGLGVVFCASLLIYFTQVYS